MTDSKYYYNGVPLRDYCKENNINISTVFSRIWKLKRNNKYSNYSEQEIIDHVINMYGTNVKYYYKGISLKQYCIKNNIVYQTILERISNLSKEYPTLTKDELVIKAIEEFNNKNYRFFYEGVPLKEYCKEHGINYDSIRVYINRNKTDELSDDDLIKQYLNKEHIGIYKYYYKGIPLKNYCDENNINYNTIITYIRKCKKSNKYNDLSDDEFIDTIMNSYQAKQLKYKYKGMSLRKYCSLNNISYYSVVSFVKRSISNESTKAIDELIEEGINTINVHGIIYYYKGIPLKDYAKEHNLNVSSLRSSILRRQLKSDKPLQEIIDECVETYQAFKIKYYYNKIPLTTFCKENDISYSTIINIYLSDYKDRDDISIDDAIKLIVEDYIAHPRKRTKYYFENQSLSSYCNDNGYSYKAVFLRMKNCKETDTNKKIALCIKEYEERLHIKQTNELFIKLDNSDNLSIQEIKDTCAFLKISYENVVDLISMDFDYNQAINMIWYFFDKNDINGNKVISIEKIKYLFKIIDCLKNSNNLDDVDYYDLIGIYKSKLYDTRNDILTKQKNYIYNVIFSLCYEYNIKVNKRNFEEFSSEVTYYLLIVINRTYLNNEGQMIKYMDLTIKGYFRTFLGDYIRNNNYIPLDVNGNRLYRNKE